MKLRKKLSFVSSYHGSENPLLKTLARRHDCVEMSLGEFAAGMEHGESAGLIVDIDLSIAQCVSLVRKGLTYFDRSNRFVIVIVNPARPEEAATAHLLTPDKIVPLVQIEQRLDKFGPAGRLVTQMALTEVLRAVDWLLAKAAQPAGLGAATSAGEAAVSDMLALAKPGAILSNRVLSEQSAAIAEGLEEHGLSVWLGMVAKHHSPTFKHCMAVTGVASAFGQSLGFSAKDLELMTIGGMLHDVGKAHIPLEILEKPSSLTDEEQSILNEHPSLGYIMLERNDQYDPVVKDAIVHHHEYLDGSGFPDRLSGSEIKDMTRLITICDVFTLLVEDRPYRLALTSAQAYERLCSMKGQLDMALVRAFGQVI
jgi:putative nucleotidyltransferase with HDIG domain